MACVQGNFSMKKCKRKFMLLVIDLNPYFEHPNLKKVTQKSSVIWPKECNFKVAERLSKSFWILVLVLNRAFRTFARIYETSILLKNAIPLKDLETDGIVRRKNLRCACDISDSEFPMLTLMQAFDNSFMWTMNWPFRGQLGNLQKNRNLWEGKL